MKRVVTLCGVKSDITKYSLVKEYNDYGIYQEVCPTGYKVHNSWLIICPDKYKIVCQSFNEYLLDELLDCIDTFLDSKHFGLLGFDRGVSFTVHPNGNKEI